MSGMNGRGTPSFALVDSIISGRHQQGVGGILCNDPQGLCVAAQGAPLASMANAGVYTNLVRLASKLQKGEATQQVAAPLISLETADRAILVKDYAGYVVAVQVPKTSSSDGNAEDSNAKEETKT